MVRQISIVHAAEVGPRVRAREEISSFLRLQLGLGNCNCLTRARLLCQKERGLKKQRDSKKSWASEEGGKLGP